MATSSWPATGCIVVPRVDCIRRRLEQQACNQIRSARWEESDDGCGRSAVRLVVCDGISFRRICVPQGSSEEHVYLTKDRQVVAGVTDFHFVEVGRGRVLFAVASDVPASSGQQGGQQGTYQVQASSSATRRSRRHSLVLAHWCESDSDFANSEDGQCKYVGDYDVKCAASDNLNPGSLCATDTGGSVFLVDATGKLCMRREALGDQQFDRILPLPGLWAILSIPSVESTKPEQETRGAAVWLFASSSLELVGFVSLDDFQVCYGLTFVTEPGPSKQFWQGQHGTTEVLLLGMAQSPDAHHQLVLLTLSVSKQGSADHIRLVAEQHLPSCHREKIAVTSGALLAGEPNLRMLCVGFEDGSFLVFRSRDAGGSNTDESYITCGQHTLSVGSPSPVVACGFVAWGLGGTSRQVALFAATQSGCHRVWVTGSPGTRAGDELETNTRASFSQASESPTFVEDQDMDEERHMPLPEPQPHPLPVDIGSESQLPALVSRASCSRTPYLFDNKSPACDELDVLIQQAAHEIRDLESEENFWLSELDMLQRSEPPLVVPEVALPSLEVPPPPKVSRISRSSQKWARAQKGLIDPVQISRSYLDKVCRPPAKSPQPYWVPDEVVDQCHITQSVWDNSIQSLSSDPLECHIRSLCQPW